MLEADLGVLIVMCFDQHWYKPQPLINYHKEISTKTRSRLKSRCTSNSSNFKCIFLGQAIILVALWNDLRQRSSFHYRHHRLFM